MVVRLSNDHVGFTVIKHNHDTVGHRLGSIEADGLTSRRGRKAFAADIFRHGILQRRDPCRPSSGG